MINKTPTVCQGRCRQHPILHYCLGCWRTMEQISNWSKYTQEEKDKILNSKTYEYIDDDYKPVFSKIRVINNSKYV